MHPKQPARVIEEDRLREIDIPTDIQTDKDTEAERKVNRFSEKDAQRGGRRVSAVKLDEKENKLK